MKISKDVIPLCYVIECQMESLVIPGIDLDKAPLHQYLMLNPKQVIAFLDVLIAVFDISDNDQARLLSLSTDELARWRETGKVTMTLPLSYQIRAQYNIYRDLRLRCDDEGELRRWMHTPQQRFLMRTLLAYMIATEPDFGLDCLNKQVQKEAVR